MSTDAAVPGVSRGALVDPHFVAVLRYGLGTTLAVALSFGFAWPLGFFTPVIVAKLLGTAGFRPSLAIVVGMVAGIALGLGLGLVIAMPLVAYPVVQLLVVGIVLFRIFYAAAGGAPAFPVTMMLVGVTVLPLVVMESPALAVDFVAGFLGLGVAALAIVLLAPALLPDPPGAAAPAPGDAAERDPALRVRQAVLSTAVVLPLLVFVLSMQLTGGILTLVFVSLLAQQPGLREGVRSGVALLLGNALGGAVAIVAFELLVMVPTYGFLLALILLLALLFSGRILGGDPKAPLWAMAFGTVLILLGGSTAPTGGEAPADFYTRIFGIFLAALYIVGAFAALTPWIADRSAPEA